MSATNGLWNSAMRGPHHSCSQTCWRGDPRCLIPGRAQLSPRGCSAASAVLSDRCSAISAISRATRHYRASTAEARAAVRAEPPPQSEQRRAEHRGDQQLGGSDLRSGRAPIKTFWAFHFSGRTDNGITTSRPRLRFDCRYVAGRFNSPGRRPASPRPVRRQK